MPAAARGSSTDDVSTSHGCDAITKTLECSPDVFINNIGIVRRNDLNKVHLFPSGDDGCSPHQVPLTTFSVNVFANYKNVGRVGDDYSGEVIISGSPDVFIDNEAPPPGPPVALKPRIADSAPAKPGAGAGAGAGKIDSKLDAYKTNPQQFYNADAAAIGVTPCYQGSDHLSSGMTSSENKNADPASGSNPGTVPEPGASGGSVLSVLNQCLQEAQQGMWTRTGFNGNPSNPNIIRMWKNIGLGYTSDLTPWCAGFASYVMKQSGNRWIPEAGAFNLGKRASEYGGVTIPVNQMAPGDLVIWKVGHVNFCYSASGGSYEFCGGNQSIPGTKPVRDAIQSNVTKNKGHSLDYITQVVRFQTETKPPPATS
jgi:hypothetical protein